ncbi:MAG: hypothetical protein ACR2PR_06605 [Pseudohongiellaceae bacterium]
MPSSNDIQEQDLVIGYRDDEPCQVTLTNEDGSVRDITGNTYEMHISNQRFPATETPNPPTLIFWIVAPALVTPTSGIISFAPSAANYDDIPLAEFNTNGKFRMHFDIIELDTTRRTVLRGKLDVQRVVRTVV